MWNLLRFWLFHRTVKVICVQIHLMVLPKLSIVLVIFILFVSLSSGFSEMCIKISRCVSIFNLFYQSCIYYCKLYCLMNIGPWQFLFLILLDLLSYLRFSVFVPLHLILAVLHLISTGWHWSVKSFVPPLYFKPFCVMFFSYEQYTDDFFKKK